MSRAPYLSPPVAIVLCLTRRQLRAFGPHLDLDEAFGDGLDWATLDARVDLVVLDAEPPPWTASRLAIAAHDGRDAPALLLEGLRRRAASEGADLLMALGPAMPAAETIRRLQALVREDPLTGLAVPRLGDGRCAEVWTLATRLGAARPRLPRAVLLNLPPTQILSETFEPVALMRADALAAVAPVGRFDGFGACVRAWTADLRRAGFSTVLDNRSIVPFLGSPEPGTGLPSGADAERLERATDTAAVADRLVRDESLRFERLAAAIHAGASARPRLLLDARNMQASFNGTAMSILGVLGGLDRLERDGSVDVIVNPEARAFHELDRACPNVAFVEDVGARRYDAALRLSQVWDMGLWQELHGWARAVGCAILDSIGVDTVYLSSEAHVRAFQFAAESADGLLFLSAFTRSLFARRFPVRTGLTTEIYYQSFDLAEYVREPEGGRPSVRDSLFVVGNDLRHKDIAATVDALANAFPFQRVTCLARVPFELGNVEAHPSGQLSREGVARLYAEAKAVIYPSFYEGFGFPVLEGLAAGAVVIARRGRLLDEVAGEIEPGAGRIADFATTGELLDVVGRLLDGKDFPSLSLGVSLAPGARPLDWRGVAARVVGFGNRLAREADGAQWRARDRTFRRMAP